MLPRPLLGRAIRHVGLCIYCVLSCVGAHRPKALQNSLVPNSSFIGEKATNAGVVQKRKVGRSGSAIVDGVDAGIEELPFAVAVGVLSGGFQTVCTGSLISPGVVLTAAHCVYDAEIRDGRRNVLEQFGMWVMYNASDASDPEVAADAKILEAQNSQRKAEEAQHSKSSRFFASVRQVKDPRGFQMGGVTLTGWQNHYYDLDDDIALLILDKCLSGVKPVRLATAGDKYDRDCAAATVLGWEHTTGAIDAPWAVLDTDDQGASSTPSKQVPNHLQRMDGMTVHNSSVCKRLMGQVVQEMAEMVPAALEASEKERWQKITEKEEVFELLHGNYGRFSTDRLICLGGSKKTGQCHGDSGGPVVVKDEDGSFVQVGVINAFPMSRCGTYPDYAQRVSFYAPWIRHVLGSDSKCNSETVSAKYDPRTSFTQSPVPPFPVDNSDSELHCKEGEWQCSEDASCIPEAGRCNNVKDCPGGSDELQVCATDGLNLCGFSTESLQSSMLACGAEITDLLAKITDRDSSESLNTWTPKHPEAMAACEAWSTCAFRHDFQTKGKRAVVHYVHSSPCERFVNKSRDVVIGTTTKSLGNLMELQKTCKDEMSRHRLWDGEHSRVDTFLREVMQCAEEKAEASQSKRTATLKSPPKPAQSPTSTLVPTTPDTPAEEPCVATTENGFKCFFPFIYHSHRYETCTTADHDGVYWCALGLSGSKVNGSKEYDGAWGPCRQQQPCENGSVAVDSSVSTEKETETETEMLTETETETEKEKEKEKKEKENQKEKETEDEKETENEKEKETGELTGTTTMEQVPSTTQTQEPVVERAAQEMKMDIKETGELAGTAIGTATMEEVPSTTQTQIPVVEEARKEMKMNPNTEEEDTSTTDAMKADATTSTSTTPTPPAAAKTKVTKKELSLEEEVPPEKRLNPVVFTKQTSAVDPSEDSVAAAVLAAASRHHTRSHAATDFSKMPTSATRRVVEEETKEDEEEEDDDKLAHEDEEECAAKTTSGLSCKFPFVYNDVWYHSCTKVDGVMTAGTYWCATDVDEDKEYTGAWGKCVHQQPCQVTSDSTNLTDADNNSTESSARARFAGGTIFLSLIIAVHLSGSF